MIPHFDEIPVGMSSLAGKRRPGSTLVGIDSMKSLVGHNGFYTVSGRGGVTVITRGSKMRYQGGQQVVLPAARMPLALWISFTFISTVLEKFHFLQEG